MACAFGARYSAPPAHVPDFPVQKNRPGPVREGGAMTTWPRETQTAAHVTSAGAAWLASASRFPRSVHALWAERPTAPIVLPCGTVFDIISAPALFGRRMVSRLWADGPGTGPVGTQRGRVLMFAAPGTAQRLPALLRWEEWGGEAPALLCHGTGDAVTVPPLRPDETAEPDALAASRWLVAPDVRHPWLPGADVLLWACVRAARSMSTAAGRTAVARGFALSPR
ncbi:bifunctional DNA primase/polymerase [Streptomyces pactum]|uniref:Bifunctional DNA primase/polymerase n=1 Tax=Streptomyces pactum TaxID=68249 RepID=A0ABS0NIT7_9ACTN|nr:bifunctional DNA primase/polymerase [Streptomyces pactum]